LKQQDFYNTLTKKNKVLDCYKQLILKYNSNKLFSINNADKIPITSNIALFPSYLQPEFVAHKNIKVTIIPQKKIIGYSVLIKNHSSIDELLRTEYKKSFRANILRFVNRFESCFDADYKMFFGHILKEEYTFLMDILHSMLTKRFNQRNDSNKILQNWTEYLDTTYGLINKKKASLFVIYNNTTPVHISINHHFGKILFVSIPSFDIDYSKFALGNVSLYKLLEWSINNHYDVMDMAYGYLEYKRRWSNHIYDFNHHIVFNNSNLLNRLIAYIEVKKVAFKNFLKNKNIDQLIKNAKNKLRKRNNHETDLTYSFENFDKKNFNSLKAIQLENGALAFIRKPINDFLYSNKEHISTLKVFETIKSKEYILYGEKNAQKLIIL